MLRKTLRGAVSFSTKALQNPLPRGERLTFSFPKRKSYKKKLANVPLDRDRQALRASLYDRQSSRGKSFSSVSTVRFGKLHLCPKFIDFEVQPPPRFCQFVGRVGACPSSLLERVFPTASIFCVFFTRKRLFENFSFFPNKKILRKTRRFSQFFPFSAVWRARVYHANTSPNTNPAIVLTCNFLFICAPKICPFANVELLRKGAPCYSRLKNIEFSLNMSTNIYVHTNLQF